MELRWVNHQVEQEEMDKIIKDTNNEFATYSLLDIQKVYVFIKESGNVKKIEFKGFQKYKTTKEWGEEYITIFTFVEFRTVNGIETIVNILDSEELLYINILFMDEYGNEKILCFSDILNASIEISNEVDDLVLEEKLILKHHTLINGGGYGG